MNPSGLLHLQSWNFPNANGVIGVQVLESYRNEWIISMAYEFIEAYLQTYPIWNVYERLGTNYFITIAMRVVIVIQYRLLWYDVLSIFIRLDLNHMVMCFAIKPSTAATSLFVNDWHNFRLKVTQQLADRPAIALRHSE